MEFSLDCCTIPLPNRRRSIYPPTEIRTLQAEVEVVAGVPATTGGGVDVVAGLDMVAIVTELESSVMKVLNTGVGSCR